MESVAWTPDDTTFRAGTSYKVKMQIMLDSWHVWAEDFTTNGKVYVNGNPAKLTKETTGSGKFSMTKYFVEYTFPEIYYGEDTFLLRAVDGDTEINVYNSGEMATLQVETEMAGGQTPYYKWYRCDENGVPYDRYTLSNGTVCNINGIPSEEMMIPRYYRCDAVIGARWQSVIFKVMLCPMGVEVDNPEETFKIVPVGETEVQLYEADTIFGLKVDVTDNGGVLADYRWYRCDENGNMLSEYPNPLSMGDRLIVEAGIPASEMLMPRYYRADACIGNTVRSVLFSVTLCPMGVEEDEYVFTFTDVSESDWYYDYVRQANQLGLINGKSADSYAPSMNMTYAEAIKLACCLNLLNKGEDPTSLGNGPVVWYSTYMDYALANGIIPSDMSDVADQYVTRAEYVTIFERALPDSSFEKKNTIPIGSIPDVAGPITESEKAIYKFYRAGIVNGTDAYGTFKPNDYVIRAEVAAILVRIVSPEYRVNAPAQLGEK